MKLEPTEEQLNLLAEEEQAHWLDPHRQARHMFNLIAPMVLEAAAKECETAGRQWFGQSGHEATRWACEGCADLVRKMKGTP